MDVDWAPDFAIDFVAERLIASRVRATWFVTHRSPAIERLRQHRDLFELGIHPNFLPGSSHGDSPAAVLQHCMGLVQDAVAMRTHGLVQSTGLLREVMTITPIIADASLYLPHTPALRPVEFHWRAHRLLRIPHFWEDDFEMERPHPCWHWAPLQAIGEGLKVLAFHPIHVLLNSAGFGPYEALKQRVPVLHQTVRNDVAACIFQGEGTQTLFTELVGYLAGTGRARRIRDICERWRTPAPELSGAACL
jgi:hypothetical protein